MIISNLHFWIYASITAAALLLIHLAGVAAKLYTNNDWFDLVMHFLNGLLLITPIGFWIAYCNEFQPLWLAVLFAFCFGTAIAAVWEIAEFILDSMLGSNLQQWREGTIKSPRGSGVIDIMGDIIANVLGTIVCCSIVALLMLFI